MWGFFSSDPIKNFPFEVGEKVPGLEGKSLWTLHNGKKKANGEEVSIFSFEIKGSSDTVVELAKSCFKRVKTLRHPNMLTYLDGLETDKLLYIVTEHVVPLETYLKENQRDGAHNELGISWGLYTVSKALSFLINDCGLVHNNVCVFSVFVNRAGEWLLGGVDFTYKADCKTTVSVIKTLPDLEKYDPPEKSQTVVRGPLWVVDCWGLGCLIWETFNGPLPRSSSLKIAGKIPQKLVPSYCQMVGANPKSRPNPAQFIKYGRAAGGFMQNTFIDTMLFLDEIQIKDQTEKNSFFQKLSPSLDSFPPQICRHKLLPQLVHAFEYGNSGSAVLAPLLKVGKMLDGGEYQKMVVPCVVKLFSSTDRNTRVKLLQQVETFVEHLSPGIVNNEIFPHVVQGFADTNPVVREYTIKAMMHLACKLDYKNMNEELMKHFARLQAKDDQGGIRTNTTICLGKIAAYINPSIRQKILISAFIRATKDPFAPSRQAGILAMAATQNYYYIKDIAVRLLPTLCALTLDPDKGVREQAFKAITGFIGKLETISNDPSCQEEMEKDVLSGGSGMAAVSGWAGWAVSGMSSLTSRLYKSRSTAAKAKPADDGNSSTVTPAKKTAEVSEDEQVASPDDMNEGWGDMMEELEDNGNIGSTSTQHVGKERRIDEDDEDDASDWGDDDNWGSMETDHQKSSNTASSTADSSHKQPLSSASSYFSDTSQANFFSNMIGQQDKKKSINPPRNASTKSESSPLQHSQSASSHTESHRPSPHGPTPHKPASHIPPSTNSEWGDSGWDNSGGWRVDDNDVMDDDAHKKQERENKRKQRQVELQAKRDERKGAMKLGVKKVGS